MERRCHLPLPKRGLSLGPVYKGTAGRGERSGAEARGGVAVSGAGAEGWDGEEGEERETLAASPPAPAPSLLRWAGGGFPPPGDSTCLALRECEGAQNLSLAAAIRLCSVPALGRAGISLGGRADSEESRRGNPVFPNSPSQSPSVFTPAGRVEAAAAEASPGAGSSSL